MSQKMLWYPTIDIVEIMIPWITCNANGVDLSDTLFKYRRSQVDLYEEFLEFANAVEGILDGRPDIVISDHGPNVAQFAYASDMPLINMEQQAKYLYLPEENIDGYGIREEMSRLDYFFPKSDMRMISSFFPLKVESNGKKIREMDVQEIERFYSEIDVYERSIQRFKRGFWKNDRRKIVTEGLCSLLK